MGRNRILGGIGILWGGGILLVQRAPHAHGAYAAGQRAGLIFGALLLFVGLYYLLKG